jgi:hypothetical protein
VVTIFAGNGVAGTHLNPASVLESEIGLPVGMVQMPDGSVLVICAGHPFPSHNARVQRIRDGVATVFAGADPGAEYSISKHDHPELRYQWPRSLAVLPDGSVALEFGPRLLRLAKGAITLIYGRSNPAFPPDPDYYFTNHSTPDELFRDIGAHDNLGIRGLAALDDGSLVIDFIHQGVMLFSPRDPWQLELQELVAQGKEALKSGQVGKFWEVEHRLEDMGSSSHSTLRTVNRGAQDSASSSSSSVAKP